MHKQEYHAGDRSGAPHLQLELVVLE